MNGDFDIRLFYKELRGSFSLVFPWKGVKERCLKVKAPQRVSFFVWTVAWDKIPRGDNLRRRGLDFVVWCVMCHFCRETLDHLLLHCEKAFQLWCFVFRSFGTIKIA